MNKFMAVLCLNMIILCFSRSHWPRGLRRGVAAAHLPALWVRIPQGTWRSAVVSVVLSGRGLCDGLITRPEESYRVLCICV